MQLPAITEINGIRVLTTKQVSDMYGTTRQVISYNFNYNKSKFQEGKHYIVLTGQALRDFKGCHENLDNLKHANKTYLWTEKGALFHAKSVNTQKAWQAYEYLVDFYFRAKETEKPIAKPEPIPAHKPPMMTVVDVPENVQIQKAIKEVQKCLYAMDVLMSESNKYCSIDCYNRFMSCLDSLWTSLGRRILNLRDIEPKQIQKLY